MASASLAACSALGLAAAALARTGFARWALLLAGGALLRRSLSGHCPLYQHLDLDRRHGRSGVPGNRGTRVESSVEIACPAETLFSFWRKLEQLPSVMRHVKSVEQRGGKRSHWKVAGPARQTVEWDAEIINEEDGRFIAWRSLPGASVSNAGSVWFEPTNGGATRVKVALEFDPPAGALGVAVAGTARKFPGSGSGGRLGALQRVRRVRTEIFRVSAVGKPRARESCRCSKKCNRTRKPCIRDTRSRRFQR